MAVSEAQKRASKKYIAANYDFIKLRLNKGEKEEIKQMAEKEGKSLTEFIRNKIFE